MSGGAAPAGVAGIDIGGTKTAAAMVAADGTVLARASGDTPAREGGDAMAETAARLVEHLAEVAGVRPEAVGVGAAGVVDPRTGVIRAASDMFVDWAGFPLASRLSERLDVGVRV